jgi:hypothetical protein
MNKTQSVVWFALIGMGAWLWSQAAFANNCSHKFVRESLTGIAVLSTGFGDTADIQSALDGAVARLLDDDTADGRRVQHRAGSGDGGSLRLGVESLPRK